MKATAAISIAALLAALAATPSTALDLNAGANGGVGVNVSSDSDNANAGVDLGLGVNASAQNDDGDGASVSVGGSLDGGVTVDGGNDGDLGVDTAATGSIGITGSAADDSLDANTRLDLLLKLIADSSYDDSSFSAWVDGASTTVVNVDDVFDADGQAQIDAALQANADEHNDLNAAINANANLKAWLDSEGIDAASVIAIDVSADGSVHVYEG